MANNPLHLFTNPSFFRVWGLGFIGNTNTNTLSYIINLYYMDIKNLLLAQRTDFDTFTGVNAGRTSHPGLELSLIHI